MTTLIIYVILLLSPYLQQYPPLALMAICMAICLSFLPLWHQGQRVKLFSSSSPWLCAFHCNTKFSNQASFEKILWTCAPLNQSSMLWLCNKQEILCICNLLRSAVHLLICACQRCVKLCSLCSNLCRHLILLKPDSQISWIVLRLQSGYHAAHDRNSNIATLIYQAIC